MTDQSWPAVAERLEAHARRCAERVGHLAKPFGGGEIFDEETRAEMRWYRQECDDIRAALARVAELEARASSKSEQVALWMIANDYATGHGDTIADMLAELEWQAKERGDRALTARAEAAERDAARMREALERIERWELPPSGEFYPNQDGTISDRPAPYDSFYANGTRGGKEAIRAIAKTALTTPSAEDRG